LKPDEDDIGLLEEGHAPGSPWIATTNYDHYDKEENGFRLQKTV
jgi:hypothetical protein